MDDLRWFWSSELGRDNMLREQLEAQAVSTSMLLRSQANDARQLRDRLKNIEGDLVARVDALSSAFAAYVELDSIREQLAGFPDHAQARRLAAADLAILAAGELPPTRSDIAGYWLVPAIAALRPDGNLNAALADTAIERDEITARRFLLAARAAFGRGPELVDELVALMAPDTESGPATWDGVQVMFWAATLRGAFGPDALERLADVIAEPLAAVEHGDWLAWASEQGAEAGTATGMRGARSIELRPIAWLADAMAAVVEPVQPGADDNSWLTWRTVDQARTDAEQAAVASQADPQAVAQSNRELLLRVAEYQIAQGAPGERELLHRAAELKRELANPTGDPSAETLDGLLPARRTTVADQIRQTAVDPNASPHDRRVLWGWIGAELKDWLADQAAQQLPERALVPVSGHSGLQANAEGPIDPSEVANARETLVRSYAPSTLARYWAIPLGVGLALLVAGIVLGVVTSSGAWFVPIIIGGISAGVGVQSRKRLREALSSIEYRSARLDESVSTAQRLAQREDNESKAFHESLTQTSRRALSMIPDVR